MSSRSQTSVTTSASLGDPRSIPAAHEPAPGSLPLPGLAKPQRITTARYALTTSDRQGRLADRSPIKALGWAPHQPIFITGAPDTIVIRAATNGHETLTRQGFLQLPAVIRHLYHIHTGDQLLIAAYHDHDLALVCTVAALDHMIDSRVRDLL